MKERMRFIVPLVIENLLSMSVTMIYSSLTGAISSSSLAAVSVGNQAIAMLMTVLAAVVTGSAIIVARQTGKGDYGAASRTVEHTLLLSFSSGLVLTLALWAGTPLLMRLFMPGAEANFLWEGTVYFKINLISIPVLVLGNSLSSVLRAVGDTRSAAVATFISGSSQLIAVFILTDSRLLNLGIVGVAYSNVVCRYCSTAFLIWNVLKHTDRFCVDKKRILKPDRENIGRIVRVGVPSSIDSLAVQLGYVVINSLIVSQTLTVSVNSVMGAVLTFTGFFQSVGSNTATTFVGRAAGAGDMPGARKSALSIFFIAEILSLVLCIPVIVCPGFCAGLYTSDPDTLKEATRVLWLLIPYGVVAVGVNVADPAVRVGGDVKYVMRNTIICVWAIRLPLTYLFCLKLNMGAAGVYTANIISLFCRTAASMYRINSPVWGKKEISAWK